MFGAPLTESYWNSVRIQTDVREEAEGRGGIKVSPEQQASGRIQDPDQNSKFKKICVTDRQKKRLGTYVLSTGEAFSTLLAAAGSSLSDSF